MQLISALGQLILLTIWFGYGDAILTRNLCTNDNSLQIICECSPGGQQELILSTFKLPNLHESASSITVRNCLHVSIGRNAISNFLNLRKMLITNIANLELEEESLYWRGYTSYSGETPAASITISNSKIKKLPRFIKDTLDELHLTNVIIDEMQPFAISSATNIRLIEIKNSRINKINDQVFKRLETKNFVIDNSTFIGIVPSRAFSNITVSETFRIINSHFDRIKPNAFIINGPERVEIINTAFQVLEKESFKINVRKLVEINNNQFISLEPGAFSGISVNKDMRGIIKNELQFKNNLVNDVTGLSFDLTSFQPKFGPIIINKTCTCAELLVWIENNEWKENLVCHVAKTTTKGIQFVQDQCKNVTETWVIILTVLVAVLVLLVIMTVVLVIAYRRYKTRKQKELMNRGRTKTGSVGLIVPDGRTYRETELHVIVEKAELLTTEL